ncbi:phosphomevalonate kinase [Streptomyces niger]|uniref:phosphomevalonate kinase n=1 Tax=Streptomyces niger TaxID=66373 RepID=UPI00069AC382|nr:phosphomevalonate kinase [Streptomyces niger]
MTDSVTVEAPGKLMIAGEYAVLTPGQPAIVTAVDRCVTVTATRPQHTGSDVELVTDLCDRPVPLRRTRDGLCAVQQCDNAHLAGPLAHLVRVVETVDALHTELARPPARVRLEACSALHRDGRKLGLGSSGAVTVAATRALLAFVGMPMTAEAHFRIALLASISVDHGPSGADLAASTWPDGWVHYSPPDRTALLRYRREHGVLATLHAPWSGLSVRVLPPPSTLTLVAGWSRAPASTTGRVRQLRDCCWWQSHSRRCFQHRSAIGVDAMAHALEQHDDAHVLSAFRDSGTVLAGLDREVGLRIFTPALTALCEAARKCGAPAKPSGAGGGDCGIALLPAGTDREALQRLWAQAGITPLALRPAADARPASAPMSQPIGPRPSDGLRRAFTAPTVRNA